MIRKLLLASAGSGKSQKIVEEALRLANEGKNILLLTYTENNQKELLKKICQKNKYKPDNIEIKGWFTFLLHELIRPYQTKLFNYRIMGINFNNHDPHKINGKNIKGTAETAKDGTFNDSHFINLSSKNAHTFYLAKLASKLIKKSENKIILRLVEIYDAIFIDEIQDLVGYDYDIIKAIYNSSCEIFYCVGDFRQTIYTTTTSSKKPKTNDEKINEFNKIGFILEPMNSSWRCIRAICDLANKLHVGSASMPPTISLITDIPEEFQAHNGIYIVKKNDVNLYINIFNPTILRIDRTKEVDLCKMQRVFTFGEAKGKSFERILIIPTAKQKEFLAGDHNIFNTDKTDQARNKFYVAITRARYSVAFLYEENEQNIPQINIWSP